MKLRDRLATLAPETSNRLRILEAEAHKLIEYSQAGAHMTFTPHGLSHIRAVEQAYDWLLSDEDIAAFNASEIHHLLAATYLHDSMMIPQRAGLESYARATHADRAMALLAPNRDRLALGLNEASVIADIIRGHGVDSLDVLPESVVVGSDIVDVRKLAACLSIADICHADESRAPEIVFQHFDLDEESASHWRRHMQISGITRDRDALRLSALAFSDDGESAVEAYRDAIASQLKLVSPYFKTVLAEIKSVALQTQRLDTPLDKSLRFKPDMPAILSILVDGVYQRDDVFVRELLQNSIDACALQTAVSLRRGEGYKPEIAFTEYSDSEGARYIRIDDNGIGMDIADIEDTVLWLGRTSADRQSVKELLEETPGKNLISTFGIGLLSCFKCADSVTIRTCKEGRTAVECCIESVDEPIRPREHDDNQRGTTVLVELNEEISGQLLLEDTLLHYARRISQVDLYTYWLEADADMLSLTRDRIMRNARGAGKLVEDVDEQNGWLNVTLRGKNYTANLGARSLFKNDKDIHEATVDILSEGIYVCTDSTSNWLPDNVKFCTGEINFAAKAVDLAASRDAVVDNARSEAVIEDLENRSMGAVRELVKATSRMQDNRPERLLTYIYSLASDERKKRILRELDDMRVKRFRSKRTVSLKEIRDVMPEAVYVVHEAERWVNPLCTFDGKQLYHKTEDLVELQASLMLQAGHPVLTAASVEDGDTDERYYGGHLISQYFNMYDISTEDLSTEQVVGGMFRSKSVPGDVRRLIGGRVKFVEIEDLHNTRAWMLKGQTWVNVANPIMARVYRRLQEGDLTLEEEVAIRSLVQIVSFEFDEAIASIAELLIRR